MATLAGSSLDSVMPTLVQGYFERYARVATIFRSLLDDKSAQMQNAGILRISFNTNEPTVSDRTINTTSIPTSTVLSETNFDLEATRNREVNL